MDRFQKLKDAINKVDNIPNHVKELQLEVVQKTYDWAMQIANKASVSILITYMRERSDDKEIERLRGLVKDAYHEGYNDLMPNEPWEFSQVKQALKEGG